MNSRLKKRPHKVRKMILGPLVLVLIFLLGAFIVLEFKKENQSINNNLHAQLMSVNELVQQGQDSNIALMSNALNFLVENDGYKNLFLRGDKKSLFDEVKPTFDRLLNKHKITHFYFLTPQRKVFLRMHQPYRFGDVINRFTAREAAKTSRPVAGLEMGPLGTLTLRLVVPWRKNGKLIGYIELGMELSEIMKIVRRHVNVDVLVSLHKNLLNKKSWQNWQRSRNRSANWDALKMDVIVDGIMAYSPSVVGALDGKTRDQSNKQRNVEVKNNGQTLRLSFLPLHDVQNNLIGEIIVVLDVTNDRHTLWVSMASFAFLSLIAGGIAFALFFVILGEVEKTLIADEKHIRAALDEKEVLLQEIHHRVKNNLQVVSSMLSLQATTETNPHAIFALHEGERRVKVMARVHDNLCRSDDMSHVTAQSYLEIIVADIHQSSMLLKDRVTIKLDVDNISLNVEQAIPIGQIVSELVSNTQEHAFPEKQGGMVTISLKRIDAKSIMLCVADDGIGIPQDMDIGACKSLGLQLVTALAKKMGGDVNIERNNGTRVSIAFQVDMT